MVIWFIVIVVVFNGVCKMYVDYFVLLIMFDELVVCVC